MANVEKGNGQLKVNCECGRVHTLTVNGADVNIETDHSGAYPPPPAEPETPPAETPPANGGDFLSDLFN